MSKNEVQHWIRYKGHETFALTEPEMKVRDIAIELGYGYLCNLPLPLRDLDGSPITLTPDGFIKEKQIAILVDGQYHKTKRQDKKNEWRIAVYNKNGIKVLIIDADWTEAKYGYPSKLRTAMSGALLKLKNGSLREELG